MVKFIIADNERYKLILNNEVVNQCDATRKKKTHHNR